MESGVRSTSNHRDLAVSLVRGTSSDFETYPVVRLLDVDIVGIEAGTAG
jgi:hypothetical protein